MTEKLPGAAKSDFTETERATLHSLAEMLGEKDDRDLLRQLLHEGVTLRQLILAYKTRRYAIASIKLIGGLIILGGATFTALKGMNMWPGK